ncbi:hypothetical protein [Streptomyces syringium]|uniref:hypothetical protein n=1 Tax=Streptomyces syringium TaxID=76729 RepID=UPI003AB08867
MPQGQSFAPQVGGWGIPMATDIAFAALVRAMATRTAHPPTEPRRGRQRPENHPLALNRT